MSRYGAGILAAILTVALMAAPARAAETHLEYIDEVNPICKNGSAAAKRALRKVRPKGDPLNDFIREVRAFHRVFKRTLRQIAAVDRPAETADAIGVWIRGLRQQKRLIDRYIVAAKRVQAARSIRIGKKAGKAQARSVKRAKRLGLKACAGGVNSGA
jgi:hypothetical protein